MAGGARPGAGRPKGVPNKTTMDVRVAMAEFAQSHAPKIGEWLESVEDPAKRLDLYLRALEYHIPKLGRVEHSGPDGGPMEHSLKIIGVEKVSE